MFKMHISVSFSTNNSRTLSSKCNDKRKDCQPNRKKYNDMKNEGKGSNDLRSQKKKIQQASLKHLVNKQLFSRLFGVGISTK